jgi:hypothetical protein
LSETWYSVGKLDCAQINVARRNYLYPLTGRVGMAEVINTYFGLRNGLSKLEDIDQEGKKKGKGGREKNLEKFSDQLTFTTELSGGVKPSLVLAPVKEKLHLASANGDFGGARKDVHDVTLSRPRKT